VATLLAHIPTRAPALAQLICSKEAISLHSKRNILFGVGGLQGPGIDEKVAGSGRLFQFGGWAQQQGLPAPARGCWGIRHQLGPEVAGESGISYPRVQLPGWS
jgi:hypothetical protein